MPDVSVVRANLGLPAICILTGDTHEVHPEDVILRRRAVAVACIVIGVLVFGWIGALVTLQFFSERCPITLPFSRSAYRRWRTSRRLMIGAIVASVALNLPLLQLIRSDGEMLEMKDWPVAAWIVAVAQALIPAATFWLLLWNKQPYLRMSRGLVVDVWIPSAAAADAIRAQMRPLLQRASMPARSRGDTAPHGAG